MSKLLYALAVLALVFGVIDVQGGIPGLDWRTGGGVLLLAAPALALIAFVISRANSMRSLSGDERVTLVVKSCKRCYADTPVPPWK